MSSTNGIDTVDARKLVRPVTAESTADRLRRELGEAIAEERVTRLEAERVVKESKDRERRYTKALAALDDTTGRQVAHREPGKPSKSNDWHISDRKLEQVFEHIIEFVQANPLQPLTVTALANATEGLSPESARRAFERLRADERIRKAGKARGGGITYKLMVDEPGRVDAT